MRVKLANTKVYQEADSTTDHVTTLNRGTLVNRKARYSNWMLVDYPSGVGELSPGWVLTAHIEDKVLNVNPDDGEKPGRAESTTAASATPSATPTASAAADAAAQRAPPAQPAPPASAPPAQPAKPAAPLLRPPAAGSSFRLLEGRHAAARLRARPRPLGASALDRRSWPKRCARWSTTARKIPGRARAACASRRCPRVTLDERADYHDRSRVLIKPQYVGFCGSDRGIWFRRAFKDMIFGSLDREAKHRRVRARSAHHRPRAVRRDRGRRQRRQAHATGSRSATSVAAESHIYCGVCYQCRIGDTHVCADDKIIGISHDGASPSS